MLETLRNRFRAVTIGAHVDDVATVACGDPSELVDTMTQLCAVFSKSVKDLKLTISPKTVIVSSNHDMARLLGDYMVDIGTHHSHARTAEDLGMEFAAGERKATIV